MIETYPFELVTLLLRAVRENQKLQLVSQTYSTAIAVLHGLDVGFNSGKGKILQDWTKEMMGDLLPNQKAKEIVSERTLAFFDSLPKFSKEDTK